MKNDTFVVIPQNMCEYRMSIREADLENDDFRIAFDEACADDKPQDAKEELFAWDFFKYGWEAAVRLLNDDADRVPTSPQFMAMMKNLVASMSDEQRLELRHMFCNHCGTNNPSCHCWNDE